MQFTEVHEKDLYLISSFCGLGIDRNFPIQHWFTSSKFDWNLFGYISVIMSILQTYKKENSLSANAVYYTGQW